MGSLRHACDWVDAHLDDFRVPRAITGSSTGAAAALKAAAELAHAAHVLQRGGPDPSGAARARRWLDFAWGEIDGGDLLREAIAQSPRAVSAVMVFLPFFLCGRDNPGLRDVTARQLPRATMGPLGWALLVPVLHTLGLAPPPSAQEQARALSLLAQRPQVAELPLDAAYLLTHECLYATGFGAHPPQYDGPTADYVAAAVPALARRYLGGAGDADILAELIFAGHAAGLPCADPEAWQTLAAAQGPAGNLIAPAPARSILPRAEHPRLSRTYHTTLAAIMAWASCAHGTGRS